MLARVLAFLTDPAGSNISGSRSGRVHPFQRPASDSGQMLRDAMGPNWWLARWLRRNSQDLWMRFFSNYAATSVSCSSDRSAITSFPSADRPVSTVDHDGGPGHVSRIVGQQDPDHRSDVFARWSGACGPTRRDT